MLTTAGALTLGGCSKNSNQPAGNAASPPQNPQQMAAAPPAPGGTGPARGAYAAPPPPMQARPPVSSPAPPPTVVIPDGTPLRVRLDQDLGSKISQTGDSFSATLADDVGVGGTMVIPRGSRAEGTVIDARPLGRFKGTAGTAFTGNKQIVLPAETMLTFRLEQPVRVTE